MQVSQSLVSEKPFAFQMPHRSQIFAVGRWNQPSFRKCRERHGARAGAAPGARVSAPALPATNSLPRSPLRPSMQRCDETLQCMSSAPSRAEERCAGRCAGCQKRRPWEGNGLGASSLHSTLASTDRSAWPVAS